MHLFKSLTSKPFSESRFIKFRYRKLPVLNYFLKRFKLIQHLVRNKKLIITVEKPTFNTINVGFFCYSKSNGIQYMK